MKLRQLKTKITSLLLAGVLAATSLVGCGSTAATDNAAADTNSQTETNQESAGSSDGAEIAFDAEENTIRFGINPGTIRTAIVILANELGYYEEEGVNFEFVAAADTIAALTSLSTGKNDIDVFGTGVVPDLTFIANGSDLVIFEGTAAEGGAIIARPEDVEKYKDLNNFENIKAALVRGESGWVNTRALLVEQGVDVNTIELVEVDGQPNVAQAVAKGEADVGFLPVEFANSYKEIGIEIVTEVGELLPLYVCCRQVTSSQRLVDKHDAFVKFTRANIRAWEYYQDEANRDEIVRLLAAYSGQEEDYVYNYLFENRTVLTLDPNKKGIERFYQSLSDAGFFEDPQDVNIDDHIDTSVYYEALSGLIEENPEDAFYAGLLETYQEYNE